MNDIGIIDIHHIGFFVKDINKSRRMFQEIGYEMAETYKDNERGIKLCFGYMGDDMVELVESDSPVSSVEKMKYNGGTRPYHICYEVDDIVEARNTLRKKKFLILNDISVSTIDGKRIIHLYHKDLGVLELIEREKNGRTNK